MNIVYPSYTSKLPYPKLPTYKTHAGATRAEFEAAKEAAEALRKAHRADQARLNAKFEADLAELHGVTGNPKASLLFAKAWDLGHSSGYSEVASYYDDLVCLIK